MPNIVQLDYEIVRNRCLDVEEVHGSPSQKKKDSSDEVLWCIFNLEEGKYKRIRQCEQLEVVNSRWIDMGLERQAAEEEEC